MFEPTPLDSSSDQKRLSDARIARQPVKRSASNSSKTADSSSQYDLNSQETSPKRVRLTSPQPATTEPRASSEGRNGTGQAVSDSHLLGTSSSTSTKSFKANPVTKPDFIRKYKVDGIPDVYYKEDWIDSQTSKRWMKELASLTEWYRPTLKVYGREIIQSREIAAFSTHSDLRLKYSGKEVKFNHVMLNKYENGSINIGKHSDNLENKVIVTVSLGAERSWIMEKKPPRKGTKAATKVDESRDKETTVDKKRWKLANGSLLVMQGDTQKDWKHEIPKELKVKDSRISITFRQLVY